MKRLPNNHFIETRIVSIVFFYFCVCLYVNKKYTSAKVLYNKFRGLGNFLLTGLDKVGHPTISNKLQALCWLAN